MLKKILVCFLAVISVVAGDLPKEPVAVIIDAYSVGNFYPPIFLSKGIKSIHIQTSKEILPIFRKVFDKDLYVRTLTYDGNLQKIIDELKECDVKCVLAGLDPGIELADKLSSALNLQSNGTRLSRARRNKYWMALALETAGVPTPKFYKTNNLNDLFFWKNRENVEYPIVLKPLDSGGTDGVYICKSEEELKKAFQNIIGKQNVLGNFNEEILAQSFLCGDEYVVNSVSLNGQPYITSILEGRKRLIDGYGFIYDKEVMLDINGKVQEALKKMHFDVLKALDITHGPAHGEYMFTKDGPILIEVAPRISGGSHVYANNESVGCNQIDLTVDAYVDHESFYQKTQKEYAKKKSFYQVFIGASHSGIIHETAAFIDNVKKLESYFDIRFKVSEGMRVPRTVDLISSLGCVFLIHENEEVILSDYRKICELSQNLCEPD